MAKSCKGCIHWRKFVPNSPATLACHYCVDTGKLRGCEPENCTHYDTDKAKLKKLIAAQKEETFDKAFGKMGERKSFCYRFKYNDYIHYE